MKGTKKILLIFPPTANLFTGMTRGPGVQGGTSIAPLGLLYIARSLIDAGYDVEFCDFNAKAYSRETLGRTLTGIDLVGVMLLSYGKDSAMQVLKDIKEISPSIPIIVGGPDCISYPRLVEYSDVTAYHEVEHTIVGIVDGMLNGGDLSECEGIFFRDGNGEVKEGLPPKLRRDLDGIRFPERSIVDPEGYDFFGKRITPKITTICTSRGCPYRCTYCARNPVVEHYRARSVENVLEEIQEIYDAGFQGLGFVDEEFLFKRDRVIRIMEGVLRRNIKLRMIIVGRVDSVDEELFSIMHEAGVRTIAFGLESGNQETLDYYEKETTVELNRRAVELCEKYKIFSFGWFILGALVETEKHIQDTIDFSLSMPLDGARFGVLCYDYGSPIWKWAQESGLIEKHETSVYADKDRGLSRFSTEELERLCIDAFNRFYRRPSLWARWIRKSLRLHDLWMLRLVLGASNRMFRQFLHAT